MNLFLHYFWFKNSLSSFDGHLMSENRFNKIMSTTQEKIILKILGWTFNNLLPCKVLVSFEVSSPPPNIMCVFSYEKKS